VDEPQTAAELEAFCRAVRENEPFGDAQWCQAFKESHGGNARRSKGRPPRHVHHCPEKMTSDPITDT
jgi:hypothetical protein